MMFVLFLVLFVLWVLLLRFRKWRRLRRRFEQYTVEESLAMLAGKPMHRGPRWPGDTSSRV